MKLGKIRHAALASVLSLALVGAWAPMAQADETTPPEEPAVVSTEAESTVEPEVPEVAQESQAPEAVEESPAPEVVVDDTTVAPSTSAEPTIAARSAATSSQTATAAAACSVTIGSAAQKALGAETYAWGNYANCGSATLELQQLRGGTWTTFKSQTISGDGSYTIGLLADTQAPGTYTLRAKIGSTYSGTTQLERLGAVTASTAGTKPAGQTTYVWGTAPAAANRPVWTEVYVDGQWSRSQSGRTSDTGYYALPLTYGMNSAGTYTYRVAVQYSDGSIVRSSNVQIVRTAAPKPPTITTAGTKQIGVVANAWGTVPDAPYASVWTEVYVNGTWSRSQTGKTDANGYYALPLTYGMNTAGSYRFRVGAEVNGVIVHSAAVTFTRTSPVPAGIDKRCMTGRALCASKTTKLLHWMINGRVIETVDVRFGTAKYPTREGQFQVNWKSRNHVSSLYGSSMPFSMFFSGGQAIHYSADFARRGQVGGSHGCINVRDWNTLERIYDQVRVGDKVVVHW